MRPEYVETEHLDYLDDLRESGITNMYGAAPYLMEEFSIPNVLARKILTYWMQSFGQEDR